MNNTKSRVTIIRKERYGCYRRKTQRLHECSKSSTILRQKLDARVLNGACAAN